MAHPFAKHKFKAQKTSRGCIRFDSKLEASYYDVLCERVKRGEVVFFMRQTPLHLPGGTRLVVDFQEFHADGTVHFVDVKGLPTETFKVKKREIEARYPIEVECVFRKDVKRMADELLG